ncbi:hypothetical protein CPC08DRAFT_118064 [Agrocybe pediades]|nr:hypothetical protein CPC08DRAFT_118064 [Agrocybe pediades]
MYVALARRLCAIWFPLLHTYSIVLDDVVACRLDHLHLFFPSSSLLASRMRFSSSSHSHFYLPFFPHTPILLAMLARYHYSFWARLVLLPNSSPFLPPLVSPFPHYYHHSIGILILVVYLFFSLLFFIVSYKPDIFCFFVLIFNGLISLSESK